MDTRPLLATLLVVCVVLAGCGGASTETTDAPDADAATTLQTSSVPPTGSNGTTDDSTDEPMTALDGGTLAAEHREALAATSYESTFSFDIDLPDGTAGIEERRIVDRAAGLAADDQTTTLTDANGTTTVATSRLTYLGNATTYERLSGTEYATVYSSTDGDGTSTRPINASDVGSSVVGAAANVDWTAAGTETVDGVAVTRYEATGPESVRQFRDETSFGESALNRVETAERANATLLVGEDGVVRRFSVTVSGTTDGESLTVSLDVRFSNVGSASVETPSWLDDAKRDA